ncbi:YSC84-related protein [Ferrimonas sp.]|uniref:BPSL1445 family SYLF domain-containing lipoprotein n=1 Tax=Ferrimonas sp. TaxID=2080861 RepID=UPI003A953268
MRALKIWLFALMTMMLGFGAQAASKTEIDAKVKGALQQLYKETPAAKELVAKARGVLVLPEVYKAGFGIGGEYGEGALLINGAPADYYATAAASFGLQVGAQVKSQVVLFMTSEALDNFRNSQGWKAGVDGSVALATLGAGGTFDSNTLRQPIIGFIFSNKGLMYNLTFEGSKFTKIDR